MFLVDLINFLTSVVGLPRITYRVIKTCPKEELLSLSF